MQLDILMELTQTIKKLYALEASIIDGNHSSNELRSKQALLISEIIQSLQRLKNTFQKEFQTIIPDQRTFSLKK